MNTSISTNPKVKIDLRMAMSSDELLEKMGDSFQNLRHLKRYSMTVEKGGWRARGFSMRAPHHHKTVNGKTPNEALYNLYLAIQ